MDSGAHGFFAVGGLVAAGTVYGISRLNLRELLDISKPGAYWNILALLVALLNLKSLPFAWHYRLIKGLLSHVSLGPRCPKSPGPTALFQPLITSSRTSLWETDYNGHKSNSTYFADLDIARMHLITCLMKAGLHRAHYEKPSVENEAKYGKSAGGGHLGVMLGGVSCHFRKEIKPFEAYEIWTRILTWDRKWVYLVSHIVKKGAIKPAGYSQQPWKNSEVLTRASETSKSKIKDAPSTPHPAIFATSIAKYVFKSGRITIPPELVLNHSELLPSRPEISDGISQGTVETLDEQRTDTITSTVSSHDTETLSSPTCTTPWSWKDIERERKRGLTIARHFAELDQLNHEYTAEKAVALGQW